MRILCLDIGTKRIGVAASDPMGWSAQPIKVIVRRGGARDLDEIASLCRELEATRLVVGSPLDAEGAEGPQAQKVRAFVERVRERLSGAGLDIPIEMWDERFSTQEAEGRLIGADVSRARRREVIDKMAAVVILEDYLRAHESPSDGGEGAEG